MFRKIMWVISLLNIAASTVALALCPQTVLAVHFGLDGQPDRWANKWTLLFMAFLPMVIAIVFELYRHFTRENEKAKKNRQVEEKVIPFMALFFTALNWILLGSALHSGDPQAPLPGAAVTGIMMAMGLLFMVIGNFMGKIQQNRWFGIRVSWTLTNETVWKKTHRFSGVLWVATGSAVVLWGVLCLVFPVHHLVVLVVFFVMLLLATLIPIAFSWRLYNQLEERNLNHD